MNWFARSSGRALDGPGACPAALSRRTPRPASWLLPSLGIFLVSLSLLAADANGTDSTSSSLRPPRGEIPASFWEQHGPWILAGAVLLTAVLGLAAWFVTRPKAVVPVPLATLAKQELESLRQLPEDGLLLSRVSQIVRRYFAAMFYLSTGEQTTAEFCKSVQQDGKVSSGLAKKVCEFLVHCDIRKFAPAAPPGPSGAVEQALAILDLAQNRVAELNRQPASGQGSQPPQLPATATKIPSNA